jgi:hypothetical protein
VGIIAPLLEEAIDFHGKRAVSQEIMVTYVRLRRQAAAETE